MHPSTTKFLNFHPAAIFFISGIVQRQFHTPLRLNFSALSYHLFRKIAAVCLPLLFVMILLKMRNIISYTAQVLLLCVKSCLPPQHNYVEIYDIVPQIRKNSIGF